MNYQCDYAIEDWQGVTLSDGTSRPLFQCRINGKQRVTRNMLHCSPANNQQCAKLFAEKETAPFGNEFGGELHTGPGASSNTETTWRGKEMAEEDARYTSKQPD